MGIEKTSCGGNEDVVMDVWSNKAGQNKERKNYRDDESGRNIHKKVQ